MTIKVCPECDSHDCRPTGGNMRGADETTSAWVCRACNATFDEPDEREPRGRQCSNKGTVAKTLEDMEADEL